MLTVTTVTVGGDCAGTRLDSFIADCGVGVSRAHGVKLIDEGNITVNGLPANKKYKVNAGDIISISIPEPIALEVTAENIALDIVYEDDSLIVVNKPQGMVVHPAAGNYSGTLVNALMNHCAGSLSGINGVIRPGIVHRIDKDTSGLLIVAKNDNAHVFLSQQLKDRSLSREYIALVNGNIKTGEGIIDAPIGRNPNDRKKMCVTNQNSREAVTGYNVFERFGRYSLVGCKLKTGRTHQIRVHMAYLGHSVVGDKTYGIKKEEFKLDGQLLHACKLKFIHPVSFKQMEFSVDLPDYFKTILAKLRLRG